MDLPSGLWQGSGQQRRSDYPCHREQRMARSDILLGGVTPGFGGYCTCHCNKDRLIGRSVASTSCDMFGTPKQRVTLTFEVWGGGGGGGGGQPSSAKPTTFYHKGGNGAGGGGGGGYGTVAYSFMMPNNGNVSFFIKAGDAGAAGGQMQLFGGNGGDTEVRRQSFSGTIIVKATGGKGGNSGINSYGSIGGTAGTGTAGSWTGTGGGNGIEATGCDGGYAGSGGAGGGPRRTGPGYVNDGGDGGHGGYKLSAICVQHAANYLLSSGT
jgi:hypothetical protein